MNALSYLYFLIDCPTVTNVKEAIKEVLKSEFTKDTKLEMIYTIIHHKGSFGICKDESFIEAFNMRY